MDGAIDFPLDLTIVMGDEPQRPAADGWGACEDILDGADAGEPSVTRVYGYADRLLRVFMAASPALPALTARELALGGAGLLLAVAEARLCLTVVGGRAGLQRLGLLPWRQVRGELRQLIDETTGGQLAELALGGAMLVGACALLLPPGSAAAIGGVGLVVYQRMGLMEAAMDANRLQLQVERLQLLLGQTEGRLRQAEATISERGGREAEAASVSRTGRAREPPRRSSGKKGGSAGAAAEQRAMETRSMAKADYD